MARRGVDSESLSISSVVVRCPLSDYEAAPVSSPFHGVVAVLLRSAERVWIELPLNRLFALSDPLVGAGRTGRGSSLGSEWRERGAIFATTCSGRGPGCSSTDNARFLAPIIRCSPREWLATSLLGILSARRERSTGQAHARCRLVGSTAKRLSLELAFVSVARDTFGALESHPLRVVDRPVTPDGP